MSVSRGVSTPFNRGAPADVSSGRCETWPRAIEWPCDWQDYIALGCSGAVRWWKVPCARVDSAPSARLREPCDQCTRMQAFATPQPSQALGIPRVPSGHRRERHGGRHPVQVKNESRTRELLACIERGCRSALMATGRGLVASWQRGVAARTNLGWATRLCWITETLRIGKEENRSPVVGGRAIMIICRRLRPWTCQNCSSHAWAGWPL